MRRDERRNVCSSYIAKDTESIQKIDVVVEE